MATESAKYLSVLHKQVDQFFNFNEIRTLCFDMGVDHENIAGDTKSVFTRNLIVSMARQNRLPELVSHLRDQRPNFGWGDPPPDFELPQEIAQENIQQVVNYNVYGDYVNGDKIAGDKVKGDKISVGDISGSEGIAIGRKSSADVQKTMVEERSSTPPQTTDAISSTNKTVQQALSSFQGYMKVASRFNPSVAEEISKGVDLVLASANDPTFDSLHFKLLCLGQMQFARQLEDEMPGVGEQIEQLITAVQKNKLIS